MSEDDELGALLVVLDHAINLDHLGSLQDALGQPAGRPAPGQPIAVGIDANVLLNLGKGRRSADVVDYLGQRHSGPIILPAQALLEFWNNRVSGVFGLGDRLRKHFDALSELIGGLDPNYDAFANGARTLMADFHNRYGHVLEEKVATQVATLLELLSEKAIVPQVPFMAVRDVAEQRRKAKVPPGFKDEGHGDFLVWAEFLRGLLIARGQGDDFGYAVFVTEDTKPDWSTKGTVHPTLRAEVTALVGASFDTWNLQLLESWVADSVDAQDSQADVGAADPEHA